MKKILTAIITLFVLVTLAACSNNNNETPALSQETQAYTIGICNYVDDASLNQIVENIQTQLGTLAAALGADEEVMGSLGQIGLSSLTITLFSMAGSLLAVTLLRRFVLHLDRFGRHGEAASETSSGSGALFSDGSGSAAETGSSCGAGSGSLCAQPLCVIKTRSASAVSNRIFICNVPPVAECFFFSLYADNGFHWKCGGFTDSGTKR